ncbi:MAG: flagellar basal body P-ring formation chaperone FlgA [Buchnera aphidicola (Brevicoryne brassicae)]|uniref:Flagella basal body P-ring formation protein FlgA n=1 Tax=Buchnera aphidicola (Brevicoryne brassicae) TaxID=911343 RepID=A0AAJ5PTV6_9GAMM|nr:flagellar basal body P-ring formation chaperone FlgA [Buchnera aphidicola]QCI19896.1 flagellar basal body P-ring formation protein FlgA [Buchnera aphidicola (Brevicoryne brassicae)]WAI18719.1 MAG: flagellar basal body P-ring formation chaperone FlgA [Buchnera aphidicola (Brevicoryne brassicae)]
MKILVYFFLFVLPLKVNSITLTDQLNNFFKKEFSLKENVNIIIRTPPKKNIYCKKPYFSILNNFHYLGLTDVIVICGKKHHYLKIELQEKGEYIVANRKIPRGTKIQESDLKILIGRLDQLPNNTYLNKKDVVNRVNLRDIFPLQPITSCMTRPSWLVEFNQQITLIIYGKSFTVSSQAKSLSNGAENENVRVKTKNGKIITGVVNKNGEVIVSLLQ